jgi:hypothetical protein
MCHGVHVDIHCFPLLPTPTLLLQEGQAPACSMLLPLVRAFFPASKSNWSQINNLPTNEFQASQVPILLQFNQAQVTIPQDFKTEDN